MDFDTLKIIKDLAVSAVLVAIGMVVLIGTIGLGANLLPHNPIWAVIVGVAGFSIVGLFWMMALIYPVSDFE